MEKLAVFFPGIGYHCDKPLLYYSKKLAAACGYGIREVPYGGFESGIKGNPEKMEAAFRLALAQAEELLGDVEWKEFEELLFVSKSVGTVVAAAFEEKYGLKAKNIFFTPVEQTFLFVRQPGNCFSRKCRSLGFHSDGAAGLRRNAASPLSHGGSQSFPGNGRCAGRSLYTAGCYGTVQAVYGSLTKDLPLS